jgi:hypothetical protein
MRKFIVALVFVAVLGAVVAAIRSQKAKWIGLTEAELRSKIDEKLADRVPDDKRAEVTDTIVTKMSEKGLVADEPDVVVDATADLEADALKN